MDVHEMTLKCHTRFNSALHAITVMTPQEVAEIARQEMANNECVCDTCEHAREHIRLVLEWHTREMRTKTMELEEEGK